MKIRKNISIIRMICTLIALAFLMIPWYQLGIYFPSFIAGGKIVIELKYIIVGFILLLSMLLKLVEFRLRNKHKNELKYILTLEKTCDMILIEGLLILLAFNGFISVVIPIIILAKTLLVDTMKKLSADNGKMNEKSKLGFCEYITMRLGILLLLFYNLPFELWDFYFADALIMIATVLAVLNGCIYYFQAKNMLVNQS